MESKVKLAGHAIHPMLIVFPLGLLATAVIFDLVYLVTGNVIFSEVAYWNILAGIVGGLAAAVFGFADWLHIPDGTRAKAVGLQHGAGNVVIVVLFGIAWLLRGGNENHLVTTVPLVLEVVGVLLALVTGWLGGELVERLRVGVDDNAHLNAPNSLTGSAGAPSVPTGPQPNA
jgi:uncharacterized membrane protein